MSEAEVKQALFSLATSIVDAAGTGGGTYLENSAQTQKEKDLANAIQKAGTLGDLAGVVGEQAFEAYKYVSESQKPTLSGLNEWLGKSKLKVSWATFQVAIKYSNQFADVGAASKCMLDVTESAMDTLDAAIAAAAAVETGGFLWPVAAAKGFGLLAQLYATGSSCGEAVSAGLSDLGKMTSEQIKVLSRIQGRISDCINKFVKESFEKLAASLNPDNIDVSPLPKAAQLELWTGLLSSLRLFALLSVVDCVKSAMTTKVGDRDAVHIANAIIIANTNGSVQDPSMFTASQQRDAAALAKDYSALSLATACLRVVEYLRLPRKP